MEAALPLRRGGAVGKAETMMRLLFLLSVLLLPLTLSGCIVAPAPGYYRPAYVGGYYYHPPRRYYYGGWRYY